MGSRIHLNSGINFGFHDVLVTYVFMVSGSQVWVFSPRGKGEGGRGEI